MASLFIQEDSDDESLQQELSRQISSRKNHEEALLPQQTMLPEDPHIERDATGPSDDEKPLYPLIPREDSGANLKPNIEDIREVDIQLNLPLSFQRQVVENVLVADDPLVVIGKGLCMIVIVANLLHVLGTPTRINGISKRSLVLVLNAKPSDNIHISDELQELSALSSFENPQDEEPRPFHVINADSQTLEKRRQLYLSGGIFSVTSRILIVDLLSGVLHPNKITGIVILNAESLKEYSNESFILEIYRSMNKWGFVKAFSESAESFVMEFSPLMRKMKDLRLKNVLLWPRFRVEISQCLNNAINPKENKVVEVKVSLTNSMSQIQFGLIECLKKCLAELQRKTPELFRDWWSMANSLDAHFIKSIDMVMIPNWHRISYEAKQLIKDIRFLRNLMKLLVSGDAVDFYEEIQLSLEANKPSISRKYTESPWLMADESQMVVSYAKKRIFNDGKYCLEDMPKWDQLINILDEISYQRASKDYLGPTLIMCSDAATCMQLTRVLSLADEKDGFRKNMLHKLQIYKDRREDRKQMVREVRDKEPERATELNVSTAFAKEQLTTKRRRTRGAAAVAAVQRLKNAGIGEDIEAVIDTYSVKQEIEGSHGDESRPDGEDYEMLPILDESDSHVLDQGDEDMMEMLKSDLSRKIWEQRAKNYSYVNTGDEIIVERFDKVSDDTFLQELMPSFIVMYEPDLCFIRRVEVHRAIHKEIPSKVFFMYYGDSVEEQGHLAAIKKEKDAFTKLIREHSMLAHHFEADEDLSHYHNLAERKLKLSRLRKNNTRAAGGQAGLSEMTQDIVIVDTREFNASLPGLLYRYGVRVVPCMLTVGDYIIAPDICLERKSISDLIGSLHNNRLVSQCKKMAKYYKYPTLLIEFDQGQSFSLEPFSERRNYRNKDSSTVHPISSKLSQDEIQMQLAKLVMRFPSLRLIWSSSPLQSVNIILELKIGREQPDPTMSVSFGSTTGQKNPAVKKNKDPSADQERLTKLLDVPGISKVEYFNIRRKVKSFKRLSAMSQQDLTDLFGDDLRQRINHFLQVEELEGEGTGEDT
ncbi:hypothetical protein HG536_0H01670 [Torulaspora globosa]|uniref:ERCC4 domain-containing protein n=1 Tax=Torulaspora globosa TaxID=48254 RepID=A0A7G3ZMQ6_9SACH|nr:uncharacterized protein HG536_0H01670 [Torulaspora globosa]QLL34792.1 hypothetical protein HG536_0H01670 [Torulaspora globosa]